jgi:hypothetical protein
VVQIRVRSGDVELEWRTTGQRLAPEALVIPPECWTESVRISSGRRVGSEVEGDVDRLAHTHLSTVHPSASAEPDGVGGRQGRRGRAPTPSLAKCAKSGRDVTAEPRSSSVGSSTPRSYVKWYPQPASAFTRLRKRAANPRTPAAPRLRGACGDGRASLGRGGHGVGVHPRAHGVEDCVLGLVDGGRCEFDGSLRVGLGPVGLVLGVLAV